MSAKGAKPRRSWPYSRCYGPKACAGSDPGSAKNIYNMQQNVSLQARQVPTVRPATMADIGLIRQMAATAFPATYRHILSPLQLDYMMEWMYSEDSLRRQMECEGHVYFVA